jgi:hypothetical protein
MSANNAASPRDTASSHGTVREAARAVRAGRPGSDDTGILLPRIANVDALPPHTLVVTWADGRHAGEVTRIDVAPIVNTYKIFRPLRKNEALFETARVSEDGDSVVWNGNEDLELSAEALEDLAEQTMTPQDFVAFMDRNNLTEEAAATVLGYGRRQIGYFKTSGPIPRVVALACRGYEATLEDLNRQMASLHPATGSSKKRVAPTHSDTTVRG